MKFPLRKTVYSSITKLKPLISALDYDLISASSLAEESNNIVFKYALDDIVLTRDIASKVQEVCNKFSSSKLEETLKAFLLETDNPTLSSYASISKYFLIFQG